MQRGVFWLIEDEIFAVPYNPEASYGIAKSGENYNHRLLWDYVKPSKCNKPFDYYPRGRVEIDNKGRPIIYLNRNIDDTHISKIKEIFGIKGLHRIHYDGSKHYESDLDRR